MYLSRAKVIIRRMLCVNIFELFKSFALQKIDDKLCVSRHVPPSCEGDWERGRFEDEAEQYSEIDAQFMNSYFEQLNSRIVKIPPPPPPPPLFFFFSSLFFFSFLFSLENITCNVILWLTIYVMGNISVLSSKWSRENFDNCLCIFYVNCVPEVHVSGILFFLIWRIRHSAEMFTSLAKQGDKVYSVKLRWVSWLKCF